MSWLANVIGKYPTFFYSFISICFNVKVHSVLVFFKLISNI